MSTSPPDHTPPGIVKSRISPEIPVKAIDFCHNVRYHYLKVLILDTNLQTNIFLSIPMEQDTYISETTKRKNMMNIFGIGMLMGCLVTAFAFIGLSPADAKSDVLSEVRESQSQVYDTATRSQNVLREAIQALDYIKASAHDNAKKMDFQGE